MDYDIRHEAGPAFDVLARRIEEITPEITPHVKEVTALPLLPTLLIRILTVDQWIDLWARYDEQLLASEVEALSPPKEEIDQARTFLRHKREAHRGMGIGAQTVSYYAEHTSVVVLADNARAAGHLKNERATTSYLCRVLAHELAHGQETAGGQAHRLLRQTPFPTRRPFTDRNWWLVVEGYAHWVDGVITSRVLGDPQTPTRPRAAPRWSSGELPTAVMDHVLAAAATGSVGNAQHRQIARQYTAAGRTISEVIAACGVDAVNQGWTHPELFPTNQEEREPLAWQRRLLGLPPLADGLGNFAVAFGQSLGTRSGAVRTPSMSVALTAAEER